MPFFRYTVVSKLYIAIEQQNSMLGAYGERNFHSVLNVFFCAFTHKRLKNPIYKRRLTALAEGAHSYCSIP